MGMRRIKETINGIEQTPHDTLLAVEDLDKERGIRMWMDGGWMAVFRSEKMRK